jgi:hypothetical protein
VTFLDWQYLYPISDSAISDAAALHSVGMVHESGAGHLSQTLLRYGWHLSSWVMTPGFVSIKSSKANLQQADWVTLICGPLPLIDFITKRVTQAS